MNFDTEPDGQTAACGSLEHGAQARQVFTMTSDRVGHRPGVEKADLHDASSAVLTPFDVGCARDGIATDASPKLASVLVQELPRRSCQGPGKVIGVSSGKVIALRGGSAYATSATSMAMSQLTNFRCHGRISTGVSARAR